MAVRNIAVTDTIEKFRTEFNAMTLNDFGDIANLDASLTATNLVDAMNETLAVATSTAGFKIEDSSSTQQLIGGGEVMRILGTTNEIEAVVSATDTLTIGLPNVVSITTSVTAPTVNAGNLALSNGSITDTGGSISFGDENLTTTGNIAAATVNSSVVPSSDTLVGRATTDTLTNKTLTQPTISQPSISAPTITSDMTLRPSVTLIFEGATDDAFETTLTVADPTADRTITLPNVSGTVITTGDTDTVTGTMINNTITSANFSSLTTLLIKNSSGSTVKTMHSPGS